MTRAITAGGDRRSDGQDGVASRDSEHRRLALVVRDDREGHRPAQSAEMFFPFLREHGFTLEVHDSARPYADSDLMSQVDLIVQAMTMSTTTAKQCAGLSAAVRGGAGLASWHGGIADSCSADAGHQHMIGAQFGRPPAKGPDRLHGEQADNDMPHRIKMTAAAAEHPITIGIADFDLMTEQYCVLAEEGLDVLATTEPARPWDPWHRQAPTPAVWTRHWGAGRIFACVPGHRLDILQHRSVNTLIRRGMLWAAPE